MRRRGGARGSTALPAALVLLAVTAALTASLAELGGIEIVLARHRLDAAAALAAADGCLATVMAGLPAGWDFASIIAGPDGVAGTADDGALAPSACAAKASAAPGPATPTRIRIAVDARAGNGRRRLDAVLGRTTDPAVPALLWLTDARTLGTLSGVIALEGRDASNPTASSWSAVAAPGDPSALDAWLAAQGPHVTASPATGAPLGVAAPPLRDLAARLQASGPGGPETLLEAGTPDPSLAFVAGDLVVDTPRRGAGLLYVDGVLDIEAAMEFAGVLVARRGVRLGSAGRLDLAGALWIGLPAPGQPALDGDGAISVRQDRATMAAADGLLPLPRRTLLLGLRDLG